MKKAIQIALTIILVVAIMPVMGLDDDTNVAEASVAEPQPVDATLTARIFDGSLFEDLLMDFWYGPAVDAIFDSLDYAGGFMLVAPDIANPFDWGSSPALQRSRRNDLRSALTASNVRGSRRGSTRTTDRFGRAASSRSTRGTSSRGSSRRG